MKFRLYTYDVPAEVTEKIRRALLSAANKENGKQMLAKLRMNNFEPASSEIYDGYSDLLKDVFGYNITEQQATK